MGSPVEVMVLAAGAGGQGEFIADVPFKWRSHDR